MDHDFVSQLLADARVECELRFAPARLDGWRRGRVRGASYPGIEIHMGASTHGMLLFAADHADVVLRVFDVYEGDLYERIEVSAWTETGIVPAQVYALRAEHRHILDSEDWSPA